MKLSYFQLFPHLEKRFFPVYLLTGNEFFLVQESRDAIIATAKQKGFTEIRRYDANKDFDWQQLKECPSLSLFNEKTLIDVRLNHKPTTIASNILTELIKDIHPSQTLLLSSEKLDNSAKKQNWYSAIDQQGAVVTIWPLDSAHYKQWAEARLKQHNLNCEKPAFDFLVNQMEGNLLALDQEINKLTLLFGSNAISLKDMMQAISDHAKFTIFQLMDVIFEGNVNQIQRILQKFQRDSLEPTLLLWMITKETRCIINIILDLKNNSHWEEITKKYQIWDNRKISIKKCLSRHNLKSLHHILLLAEKIDCSIKGIKAGHVWNMLEIICLKLAGIG